MKLIKPKFEIWDQAQFDLSGIYKHIEKVGRVCYRSNDKISDDSAKPFVDRMIRSSHGGVLEHGTVYLTYYYPEGHEYNEYEDLFDRYVSNEFSKVETQSDCIFITTNYRVLVENEWLDDLKYMTVPTDYHHQRLTVHFTCSRGVWNEFIRHRSITRTDDCEGDEDKLFSYCQESTRYCNYSKGRFGKELMFIIPSDSNIEPGDYMASDIYVDHPEYGSRLNICERIPSNAEANFMAALIDIERRYMNLTTYCNYTAQQASRILPNATKTELVMTGYIDDWKHFLDLRALGTTGAPHPDAYELAYPLYEEFKSRDL